MVQHQQQSSLFSLPFLEIHSPSQRPSLQIHSPLDLFRLLLNHPPLLFFFHPAHIHFFPSHSASTSTSDSFSLLPLLIPLLPSSSFSSSVPQPHRLVMFQHR